MNNKDNKIATIDLPQSILTSAVACHPQVLHLATGSCNNCVNCGATCCDHRNVRFYVFKGRNDNMTAKVRRHFDCSGNKRKDDHSETASQTSGVGRSIAAGGPPLSTSADPFRTEPSRGDKNHSVSPRSETVGGTAQSTSLVLPEPNSEGSKHGKQPLNVPSKNDASCVGNGVELLTELLKLMSPVAPSQRRATRRNRNRRHRNRYLQSLKQFSLMEEGDALNKNGDQSQPMGSCKYCKSNRETKEFQKTHSLFKNGVVSCPILRQFVCPICKATGDFAHTVKYCPFQPISAAAFDYRHVIDTIGRPKIRKH